MNSSESSSLTGSSNAVISHKVASEDSLSEVHRSIYVPSNAPFWRKMLAFFGPGFMVAVGYMDPGNWATDLAAGAQFGYTLLSVIMISNLMAILFQHLCVKLGIATNRDLAQACRDNYSRPTVWFLWILCEIQVAACDLAEVVGSAIALLASGQNSTLTGHTRRSDYHGRLHQYSSTTMVATGHYAGAGGRPNCLGDIIHGSAVRGVRHKTLITVLVVPSRRSIT